MARPESSDELRALMYEEAAAAEAAALEDDDGAPLPPHVKVSRPGRASSAVLQVRLNPQEFQALEQIAISRELPVSTIAREQLLRYIAEQSD